MMMRRREKRKRRWRKQSWKPIPSPWINTATYPHKTCTPPWWQPPRPLPLWLVRTETDKLTSSTNQHWHKSPIKIRKDLVEEEAPPMASFISERVQIYTRQLRCYRFCLVCPAIYSQQIQQLMEIPLVSTSA